MYTLNRRTFLKNAGRTSTVGRRGRRTLNVLVIAEVATWEVIVALVGMLLATALLRRAAGKVFAMAILMRGKELGWRENMPGF